MHDTLQQVFGYPHFRLGQEETVSAVLAGRSAAAARPTKASARRAVSRTERSVRNDRGSENIEESTPVCRNRPRPMVTLSTALRSSTSERFWNVRATFAWAAISKSGMRSNR